MMSWPKHVHTHCVAEESYVPSLATLGLELCLITFAAAFTDLAYNTVLQHLSGRRALHDWQPLAEVSRAASVWQGGLAGAARCGAVGDWSLSLTMPLPGLYTNLTQVT